MNQLLRNTYTIFIVLCAFGNTFGQRYTGSISGFVRDASNGEPLGYVNIVIMDTQMGASSNDKGYYVISRVPTGNYSVFASMIGFKKITQTVRIATGQSLILDFELERDVVEMEQVVVTGERARFEQEVEISSVTLNTRDLQLSPSLVEPDLRAAIRSVLSSSSDKKLVIAGPGTGKTTLFKQLLELTPGEPDRRLVLTFINNLRDDLEDDLGGLAQVFTLHSYCLGLLHRYPTLRGLLSPDFRICPGLASIIAEDWKIIEQSGAPHFVGQMRALSEENQIPFYLTRGEFYDAVDFDDTVYRVYDGITSRNAVTDIYDLILIDEYQDFNALEACVIDALSERSPILIAGDDDQALYSQLRDASWDHIRLLNKAGDYEVFNLPFCMRCPKVIVDAVNDVLTKADEIDKLEGRIKKPFKYFPLVKGADSAKYPKIFTLRPQSRDRTRTTWVDISSKRLQKSQRMRLKKLFVTATPQH